ncbi:helix-turn-helix transcriptional regulator [Providencia sp. JGM181]|uniref:helix-turn-helix transcriptional regulator n=1 Tax=Providencia TaxID=586 RepID=UPI0012B5DB33|nr:MULTISPECIES: helix-turn-helix transcriptional regulator [Providencia]MTC75431.1 helix-turn-helix domain-containing protein [Providencia sp. wls1919]MBS0925321.1 helix-turn-helix transcriptional regulator [Providencia sp. JGM181]MBS0932335.1 helix-turn-helix transcriptional regulator [Providencia sp. JGM172]MBS0996528.1 helix-turn-helix transcriptional regulator [Providencia sp. JGM178]MTC71899.1 helix-turn-helix domain-containing protein [Providencia sp. wls1914]
MLKQYYPPDELKEFVSSVLIIKKFTDAIKIFPGTGAEIWVSTENISMSTHEHTSVNPFQLIIPRVNIFTAIPNNASVMVLRIRHDALRFLLPQRTLNYTDIPTPLSQIWSNNWFKSLANSSFKELHECFYVTKAAKKAHFIDHVLDSLYRNPNKKITEIADDIGYSARLVQKEFLKEFGITPKRYQINCRLEQVMKTMVKEQDTYRWFETGYYDQSHFYRDFKRYFTMTPSAFLKSNYSLFYNTKTKSPLR